MITADYGALEFYQVRHADSNHLTWDLVTALVGDAVAPDHVLVLTLLDLHLHVIIKKTNMRYPALASLIIFFLKWLTKYKYDLKNIMIYCTPSCSVPA